MKTLILYDENGKILLITQGNDISDIYKCIVTDIDDNKIVKSVNVDTGQVITEDKNTRFKDLSDYIKNADDTTISKIEDTILEIESNKTLEEEV